MTANSFESPTEYNMFETLYFQLETIIILEKRTEFRLEFRKKFSMRARMSENIIFKDKERFLLSFAEHWEIKSGPWRVANSITRRQENLGWQKVLEVGGPFSRRYRRLAYASRFLATSATFKDPQAVLAKRGNVRPSRHPPRLLERIQRSGYDPTMLMVSSRERLWNCSA